MEFSLFFQPVNIDFIEEEHSFSSFVEIHSVENGFPDVTGIDIAIIGVKESRGAVDNEGSKDAPDEVRRFFYKLKGTGKKYKIADLGNIVAGDKIDDTYFALRTTLVELLKKNILPVIIGGSQDLTFANYLAYQELEQVVNIVSIDNQFDLGKAEDELNSKSFLSKIILHQPNYLFNYGNLGYQSYFVDSEAIELVSKLYFDAYRLGEFNQDMSLTEPVVRNADLLSFDVSSIRMSDAPGCENATPNGLYGEQACQVARYAGMSDKLTSVGFYELNPSFDNRGQTAHLVAQMIWYLIDGFYNRKKDFPLKSKKHCIKYRVFLEDDKYELLFYKSKKSDRWWIEVPYPPQKGLKYERHHMVPCSYADYERAASGEMPDVWWKTYQKLL
jgi:formiminoglutamase